MHTSTPSASVSPAKPFDRSSGGPLLKLPAPPPPRTIKPTALVNALSRIVEVPYDYGRGPDLPPGVIEISMSAPRRHRPRSEPTARVGRHMIWGDSYNGSIAIGEAYISLDEVEHVVTALMEVATRTRLTILGARIDEPGKDLATGNYDWDKFGRDMKALRELENADRDYGDEQPEASS